jgi:tetratricopeptide (TPR) repeat protein
MPDMKLKQQILMFMLIVVMSSAYNDLLSQKILTKPTRQSSLEEFSKGNYEQAYNEFGELLKIYTKDPLYNYYAGVCLVKLNRNPGEAVTLLKKAVQGAAVVKTLPSDAPFYLGRALQMSGKFPEAIESYNLFTKQVGKKTARESGVPEFIRQCNEKKGEIAEPDVRSVEAVEAIEKVNVDTVRKEPVPVAKVIVMQPVEKEVSPKTDLPVSYEKLLDQALEFQYFADSLNSVAAQQKKELEKLPDSKKSDLKLKISENELLAVSYQKSADQKYSEAQIAMNPVPETTEKTGQILPSENKTFKDSVLLSDNKTIKDTLQRSDNKTIKDPARKSDDEVVKETVKQPGTIKASVPVINKPAEIFALFEVLPKPETSPVKKVIIDPEVPDGLIYRIQIAAFRNPVAISYFKGISPVFGFKITGTDRTNYYAGMFRRISDARKALATVKANGFKDAFLVAFSGNKVVSTDRAVQMEKEWGNKSIVTTDNAGPRSASDTIPPTLSFRVEVIKSVKPLKEDVTEGIKKMAGNRGMNIQQLDDGSIACYVGKFITFESAAKYADLMTRNGYHEARVVAFLGEKEVPVETAKQLFENLK